MIALIHYAHGLHFLHLPRLVADGWRAINFALAAMVLGGIWTFQRWPELPGSRRVFMWAVALVVLRSVVAQLERWAIPITIEGSVIDTVYLVVMLIGFKRWRDNGGT